MSNRVTIDPYRSPRYSYPWISFNPSPRTTLGWPKSNIITRFFATTTCTTISGHPCHGGYNIPYHCTHCCWVPLWPTPSFQSNHPLLSTHITGLYLDISSRTHQWQSESLWIPIHVNNLQNKSCIPLSSPYALDLKMGFKFHHSDETPAMCGNCVDSCWCDMSAWRLGGGVWT